jgi:rhodanese-related sulfurtransferase
MRRWLVWLLFGGWAVASPALLTPEQFQEKVAQPEVLTIDVRSHQERAELGALEDSLHIPLDQLETRLAELPRDRLIIPL